MKQLLPGSFAWAELARLPNLAEYPAAQVNWTKD